jgi:UDP-N-acetylglucosamine--N-acetylmuramyl-(pentapeptide) pyrophosphoryl-undecaprenol N-acetylglucosamine transferase
MSARDSDILIIGGGHNGLVCAAYLAGAGLKVCVLERRGIVGGAAVTEEFHPGFRNSSASYTVSLLNPQVIADLRLAEHGLRVALQYKGDDADAIAARLREAGIAADVRPFFDDMGTRLRAAHLVIARAGATTAADLLTVGRPAIFVPIPHGGSREEQRRNAETLAEAGVGWCVPESEFTAETLSTRLAGLFASTIKLPQAAAVAASMARPQAASNLADLVERLLAQRTR